MKENSKLTPSYYDCESIVDEMSRQEVQNSKLTPSYYDCEGGDIIDIVGVMFGREMQIGFINGNILKYIKRWDSKNGLIDLRKAREYLDRLIEIVESMETTEEHKKDVCKKRC